MERMKFGRSMDTARIILRLSVKFNSKGAKNEEDLFSRTRANSRLFDWLRRRLKFDYNLWVWFEQRSFQFTAGFRFRSKLCQQRYPDFRCERKFLIRYECQGQQPGDCSHRFIALKSPCGCDCDLFACLSDCLRSRSSIESDNTFQ